MPGPEAAHRETARAKINLTLAVGPRRNDGYHQIESLIAFAETGDRLAFAAGPKLHLESEGPFASALPPPAQNLALRAARSFIAELPPEKKPAGPRIRLVKNLPVAAGLGGGSADAAAVLRALSQITGQPPPGNIFRQGADIPACLASAPVWASGAGENLRPVQLPPLACLLVNPDVQLAAKEIFDRFDREGQGAGFRPLRPPARFKSAADLITFAAGLHNDLEAPARLCAPVIGEALAMLRAASPAPLLVRMSGSGPACFGLFQTLAQAGRAARSLKARKPEWWIETAGLRPCG